jgi:hypothetical protein
MLVDRQKKHFYYAKMNAENMASQSKITATETQAATAPHDCFHRGVKQTEYVTSRKRFDLKFSLIDQAAVRQSHNQSEEYTRRR